MVKQVAIPLKQGLIFNAALDEYSVAFTGRNPFEAGTNFQ